MYFSVTCTYLNNDTNMKVNNITLKIIKNQWFRFYKYFNLYEKLNSYTIISNSA